MHPVTTTLSRVFDEPPERIRDETLLRSMAHWDDLTAVELMVHLEHELGTTLDNDFVERIDRIQSVGELRGYFDEQRELLARRHATQAPAPAPVPPPRPGDGEPGSVDVGVTAVSDVDPVRGHLSYRGYPIGELAGRTTFEEVAHLLLRGWLPDPDELTAFRGRLATARELPPMVSNNLAFNAGCSTSAVLRTAVSALAVAAEADTDPAAHIDLGERMIARIPTIFATQQAARSGRPLPSPDPELGHAENILHMLELPRDPERVRLVDLCLILQAEHGCNASAYAARVAAGTGADTFAAVTVALATFTGPLHGGAASQVVDLARGIEDPGTAAAYLRGRADEVTSRRRRPAPPTPEDPRVAPLRRAARQLPPQPGGDHVLQVLEAVRTAADPARGPRPYLTVDCYAAAIYHLLGMPSDLFVPMFAAARIPGWLAHIEEEQGQPRLAHPRLSYAGPRNLRRVR